MVVLDELEDLHDAAAVQEEEDDVRRETRHQVVVGQEIPFSAGLDHEIFVSHGEQGGQQAAEDDGEVDGVELRWGVLGEGDGGTGFVSGEGMRPDCEEDEKGVDEGGSYLVAGPVVAPAAAAAPVESAAEGCCALDVAPDSSPFLCEAEGQEQQVHGLDGLLLTTWGLVAGVGEGDEERDLAVVEEMRAWFVLVAVVVRKVGREEGGHPCETD